jgi:hypothetical protein
VLCRHYWSAAEGLSQHSCGWGALGVGYEPQHSGVILPSVVRVSVQVRYCKPCGCVALGLTFPFEQVLLRWLLLSGFHQRLMPCEHPLLLARPPEFTDSDCTYVGGT